MSEALFQIGVKALIRNEDGDLLLEGKRRDGGLITYDLPGGRIDEGETIETALRRELKEEIGLRYDGHIRLVALTISKSRPAAAYGPVGLAIALYEIEYDTNHVVVLGEEEDAFLWASPDKAAEYIAHKYGTDFCEIVQAM